MSLPSKPVPPEMVAQIALGMEEGVDIAYRFGYSASEYRALEAHKPFVAEVGSKRAELERGGMTVKVKAAWMTENLLDDLFLRAKSENASIAQVQDTIKIMAKLGDLEPKNAPMVATGTGFVVNIVIPPVVSPQGTVVTPASTTSLTFPTFPQAVTDIDDTDTPLDEDETTAHIIESLVNPVASGPVPYVVEDPDEM